MHPSPRGEKVWRTASRYPEPTCARDFCPMGSGAEWGVLMAGRAKTSGARSETEVKAERRAEMDTGKAKTAAGKRKLELVETVDADGEAVTLGEACGVDADGGDPRGVECVGGIRISGGKLEVWDIGRVVPYAGNARRHDAGQIAKIRGSLRKFGFVRPLLVDEDGNLIAGHGTLEAARTEGMTRVPVVIASGLSEVDRQSYLLADNALAEMSSWDPKILGLEVKKLTGLGVNMGMLGLKTDKMGTVDVQAYTRAAPGEGDGDWFENRERGEKRQEGNDEYNAFVEKFEPKRTTDDCYTPDIVYDAVADWTAAEYGLGRSRFVRPFYPGGDYQGREYGPEDVVVDNPPFSLLAEIIRFYSKRGVRYFLFAPSLTLFGIAALECGCCIDAYADITYENGASVCTSFVTNLEPEDVKVRTAPALTAAVAAASDAYMREARASLPKYVFPLHVLTSSVLGRWSQLGIDFSLRKSDFVRIASLDAMKAAGKDSGIYGGALLLSEKAAAEKAAAEKAAAEKAAATRWTLSDRELDIVRALGSGKEWGDTNAGGETAD